MSNPTELETVGGPSSAGEGTGWTLLRYGWPALLLFLALAWGYLAQPVGLDGQVSQEPYGLSPAALAEGRWTVIVTHVFISSDIMPGIVAAFVAFVAAVTAPALRNPDWMGGWRLLAVFTIAAAAAAAAHLLSRAATPLLGPWPGLSAVALWLVIARRGPQLRQADVAGSRRSNFDEALNLALPFIYVLVIGGNEIRETIASLLPGFKPPVWLAFVAIAAVGLLGFVVSRIGGEIGRKILAGVLGLLWLCLVISLAARFAPNIAEIASAAANLPWAAWIAALAVGFSAGFLERRALKAH